MSLSTFAKKPLALPLTDTVMLTCEGCQPEMHPCPGRLAAPGLAVTRANFHGGGRLAVTHVRTGRKIIDGCCLRGAWEAARALARPRDFRWTAKHDTLAKKQSVVRQFVLDATGVEMFHEYQCGPCSEVSW